jgi:hypothetical protein
VSIITTQIDLERVTRMGEGMCQFRSSPKEIKYLNEDNVKKKIRFFCVYIFFSIVTIFQLKKYSYDA